MNILKSKAFPELNTERLLLRSPHSKDAARYHQILSCPETSQYSDVPHNPTAKRSERFVSWMSKLHTRGTGAGWIIASQDTKEILGAVRIYGIEKKARCGMIGYELHPDHWGIGVTSEAVNAVVSCAHGDMNLHRIEAWTSENNIASEQVLRKNGFQYEGTQRQKAWFREQHWNIRLYGHLASD